MDQTQRWIEKRAQCRVCQNWSSLKVKPEDIQLRQNGTLIQNALPYLNADERELLISGICGTCFDLQNPAFAPGLGSPVPHTKKETKNA